MIFILHYLLFNAGLSAILILQILFLQTYSDASLTEIGTLLMVLPFISILMKPLFCALADRQQAHKLYLMGSLAIMAIGYGSLAVPPFFPDFIENHGGLVWCLDILGIVIGFSAFGVAWSLGDALAVNGARMRGVSWGTYRVWATVSWGVGGFIVGQINETPYLPKYVPAFLVLVGCCVSEILLLAVWPNRHFIIKVDEDDEGKKGEPADCKGQSPVVRKALGLRESMADEADSSRWAAGSLSAGSARMSPLVGALANVLVDEVGQSLRSTLGRSRQPKRGVLAEVLEQHKMMGAADSSSPPGSPLSNGSPGAKLQPADADSTPTQLNKSNANSDQPQHQPVSRHPSLASPFRGATAKEPWMASLGRSAHLRSMNMDSLSSRTGYLVAQELLQANSKTTHDSDLSNSHGNSVMLANLDQSFTKSQMNFDQTKQFSDGEELSEEQRVAQRKKYAEDLQLMLLKLIVRRDPGILKYLLVFVLLGVLFTAHLTFFFTHLEEICRLNGYEFSHVMGALLIAHAASEVVSFLIIVPYYMPFVGRVGSMLTIMVIFAIRFGFYGTYFVDWSPWWALVTESGHGFGYGITHSLIVELGSEYVDKLDLYLPELIERRIVPAHMNAGELKLPLRATMFGLFSGAFDGLGNGMGALLSGIYLDSNPYVSLWRICAYASCSLAIAYILTEWRTFCNRQAAPRAAS